MIEPGTEGMELLEIIRKFAFGHLDDDDVHGRGHTVRVYSNVEKLLRECGTSYGADPFTVLAAALLHDIGRKYEREMGKHHALISAEISEPFLKKILGDRRELIGNIIHAIISHSFSAGVRPRTPEAQLLGDADKLDALGAIGVYRAICFQHDAGTGIEGLFKHYIDKLSVLKERMHTEAARRMADERSAFMQQFIERLRTEARPQKTE